LDSLDLAHSIADILLDKQGEDILILDLRDLTTITDYFVICSGNNRRQLDTMANVIQEALKKGEERTLAKGVEGSPESGWILIDYNSVIVHLFDNEMRRYYQLEQLWDAGRVVARIQ
jgi:ribosome-associated protein